MSAMSDLAGGAGGQAAISIEQLIALNDEIAALTRSGMPLEQGLRDLGADLPGRLRTITTALGERMSRGESLPEALEASTTGVPRVYRAVVEAGLKSGRLTVALEGLATYARGFAEARRSIGLALWYPLIVLTLAYALFIGIIILVVPRFLGAFRSLQIPTLGLLELLDAAGRRAWLWGPLLPTCIIVFLIGWVASRRALSLDRGQSLRLLRWFPWLGTMMQAYEAASFADLLALLLEHNVTYAEALVLAGDASGEARLAAASRDLAGAVERGLPLAEALVGKSAFPPLLRWLLASAPQQGDLVNALRVIAKRYLSLARFQADKIRLLLPTVLLLGLGTSATLLYALTVFVPLTSLWTSLARQAP
jgi:general secretion pathway protein F